MERVNILSFSVFSVLHLLTDLRQNFKIIADRFEVGFLLHQQDKFVNYLEGPLLLCATFNNPLGYLLSSKLFLGLAVLVNYNVTD